MLSSFEKKRYRQTSQFAYRILIPSLLFIVVFIAFPLLYSVSVAFQEFKYGVPTGKIIPVSKLH